MVNQVIEIPVKDISVEKRCEKCGKLLFKLKKKNVDKIEKSVIIISRCTRCGCDNNIKI